MSHYAALIDPAEFGLIADYLRSPRAPIDYLLHVKSKAMLATVAEELDRQRHVDTPPWLFPEPVERGLREGSLLISPRYPSDVSDPKQAVQASAIPRHAICHVIWSPPFYLVHTPGLFEGTLLRQEVRADCKLTNRPRPKTRMKL